MLVSGLLRAELLNEGPNDGVGRFWLVVCVGDSEEVEEMGLAGGVRMDDVAQVEEGVTVDVEAVAERVDGANDGLECFGLLREGAVRGGGPAVLSDVDWDLAGDAGGWKPGVAHGLENADYGRCQVAGCSGRGYGTEDVGEKVEADVVQSVEEIGCCVDRNRDRCPTEASRLWTARVAICPHARDGSRR